MRGRKYVHPHLPIKEVDADFDGFDLSFGLSFSLSFSFSLSSSSSPTVCAVFSFSFSFSSKSSASCSCSALKKSEKSIGENEKLNREKKIEEIKGVVTLVKCQIERNKRHSFYDSNQKQGSDER